MLKYKIAVIGLDGLGWNLVNKFLERGFMSFLKSRLSKRAIYGKIISPITPDTPPAWVSLSTGVNPGIHGVPQGCFFYREKMRMVSSLDVEYPRIHHMLALLGIRSLIFNMYLTYPPLRSNYITMLVDRFSPKTMIVPSDYSRLLNNYISYNAPGQWPKTSNGLIDYDCYLESLKDGLESRVYTLLTLMDSTEWNLVWAEFHEPDLILHMMYNYVMSKMNRHLAKIFMIIDKLIKEIYHRVNTVIIISDHGFAEYKYRINVARILYELGLFRVNLNKLDCLYRTLRKMLIETFSCNYYLSKLASKILTLHRMEDNPPSTLSKYVLTNSIAFVHPCNIRGIVVRSQNKLDKIIKILSNIRGLSKVAKREEIYHGPYVRRAPDILIFPKYDLGYTLSNQHTYTDFRLIMKGRFYDHHPEGLFIAFGDSIVCTANNIVVSHYDIVPTILYSMGLPLPHMTDGRVIREIIFGTGTRKAKIKYKDYLTPYKLTKNVEKLRYKAKKVKKKC